MPYKVEIKRNGRPEFERVSRTKRSANSIRDEVVASIRRKHPQSRVTSSVRKLTTEGMLRGLNLGYAKPGALKPGGGSTQLQRAAAFRNMERLQGENKSRKVGPNRGKKFMEGKKRAGVRVSPTSARNIPTRWQNKRANFLLRTEEYAKQGANSPAYKSAYSPPYAKKGKPGRKGVTSTATRVYKRKGGFTPTPVTRAELVRAINRFKVPKSAQGKLLHMRTRYGSKNEDGTLKKFRISPTNTDRFSLAQLRRRYNTLKARY